MSDLGQLLELLHDAHSQLSTFQVEFRDWSRRLPSNDLTVLEDDHGKPQLQWSGLGPWPREVSRTHRIWLDHPDRLRVEVLENEKLLRLAIRAGSEWWRWDAVDGTTGGSALPDQRGMTTLPPLLSPPVLDVPRLLATMRFQPAGTGERAGRAVMCARALPRYQPPGRGKLSYEFEFDAEHGSLLRRANFEDGRCVWQREAREVLYGSEIKPGCFVFVAPDA